MLELKLQDNYEVWYVSNHGFGHITRCMAQIERRLLEYHNYKVILISGKSQIEFAKVYFKEYGDKVIFRSTKTDVGLVTKSGSLEVDKDKLEEELNSFIYEWHELVEMELIFLAEYSIGEIYTDISPIGILVTEKLKKRVNLVSNFTWYQQYKYLHLDLNIQNRYLDLDKKIDTIYSYPLSLNFDYLEANIKKIEFIARKIDREKIKTLKKRYGKILFISCGKSADIGEINITNFQETIFVTSGVKIKSKEATIVELPQEILDTQNYIGASEFIISKAGWGTISEAVASNISMVLIERKGVLEDTHNIKEIKKYRKVISKNLEELREIDYKKIAF